MSHYGLIVCLPVADEKWRDAAEAAMEPFRIDDETGRGEWDDWHTSGGLWVRPECVEDPLIVPSSTEWPGDPLRCDGGPKRVLDLAGMRSAAIAVGRELWAAWQDAVRRHPPALPIDAMPGWDAYYAQPLVREFASRPGIEDSDVVAWFGDDEESFLARRAEQAIMSSALLTTDGRWLDAEATPGYPALLRSYLDDLPDDAFVIELDCHS